VADQRAFNATLQLRQQQYNAKAFRYLARSLERWIAVHEHTPVYSDGHAATLCTAFAYCCC